MKQVAAVVLVGLVAVSCATDDSVETPPAATTPTATTTTVKPEPTTVPPTTGPAQATCRGCATPPDLPVVPNVPPGQWWTALTPLVPGTYQPNIFPYVAALTVGDNWRALGESHETLVLSSKMGAADGWIQVLGPDLLTDLTGPDGQLDPVSIPSLFPAPHLLSEPEAVTIGGIEGTRFEVSEFVCEWEDENTCNYTHEWTSFFGTNSQKWRNAVFVFQVAGEPVVILIGYPDSISGDLYTVIADFEEVAVAVVETFEFAAGGS